MDTFEIPLGLSDVKIEKVEISQKGNFIITVRSTIEETSCHKCGIYRRIKNCARAIHDFFYNFEDYFRNFGGRICVFKDFAGGNSLLSGFFFMFVLNLLKTGEFLTELSLVHG